MDEQQLTKFIDWVSSTIPEFKNASPEQIVQLFNKMSESEEGKAQLSQIIKAFQQESQAENSQMFKKGGKLSQLVEKTKKKKGENIPKAQKGVDMSKLRQRGTTPAYTGDPDYFETPETWISSKNKIGAKIKNIFSGNTLRQFIVTDGVHGTPREVYREITNYGDPTRSDTTYVDAYGNAGVKNPSFIQKYLLNDAQHSKKFMNGIDLILQGYDPIQFSEKEVKQSRKK